MNRSFETHSEKTSEIQHAAHLLRQGKLVAIPTETVYGLAADAKNPQAIAEVYDIKGRPPTNPLIIHLSDIAAIDDWAIRIPETAIQLAEHFWPGPLTLILNRHPNVPKIVTANQDTVGLRVPQHPITLALLREFGGGLAAPSANRYGCISPTSADHVKSELGEKLGYILDGGPCRIGIESTIVYCVDEEPVILRKGSIGQSEIEEVLGKKLKNVRHGQAEISVVVPGSDHKHYAPQKKLFLLEAADLFVKLQPDSSGMMTANANVMSFSEKPKSFKNGLWIQMKKDPIPYAAALYANLRALDQAPGDCILIEQPPMQVAWEAIWDRLSRAAY